MNTNKTIATTSLALTMIALLGACANQPTVTELTFGDSVRQIIQAQTYDASTLSTPSEETIVRTDGQMLEGAIETYRGDVADPAAVSNDIVISVGGQ